MEEQALFKKNDCQPDIVAAPQLTEQSDQLLQKGHWVAIRYGGQWFPGVIDAVDDREVRVDCLQRTRSGRNSIGCKFMWPAVNDCFWYDREDILCRIQPLRPISTHSRILEMSQEDIQKVQRFLN